MILRKMGNAGHRRACVALALLVAILLSGCSAIKIAAKQANVIDPPMPEKTVVRFIQAANEMDIGGMLDCCTFATQGSYGILVKVLGNVLNGIGIPGIDFSSLLSNDEYVEGMSSALKGTYGIEILDMSVEYADDRHATVTCNCRLFERLPAYLGEVSEQTHVQEDVLVVGLVYENEDWKIDATGELMGATIGMGAALQ